jgi:hypothetical protein
MKDQWLAEETTRHQDHVIAHVIGTTVLGYFVHDETLHLVLDIGFIWTIYLDGQMVLLPQSVAIGELQADAEFGAQLKQELENLGAQALTEAVSVIARPPVECLIKDVGFFASGDCRRLLLNGDEGNLVIETSLATAMISIRTG